MVGLQLLHRQPAVCLGARRGPTSRTLLLPLVIFNCGLQPPKSKLLHLLKPHLFLLLLLPSLRQPSWPRPRQGTLSRAPDLLQCELHQVSQPRIVPLPPLQGLHHRRRNKRPNQNNHNLNMLHLFPLLLLLLVLLILHIFLHCLLTPLLLLLLLLRLPLPVVHGLPLHREHLQSPPRHRPHLLRLARGRGRQDGGRSCAVLRPRVQESTQGDPLVRQSLGGRGRGESRLSTLHRRGVDMGGKLILRLELDH